MLAYDDPIGPRVYTPSGLRKALAYGEYGVAEVIPGDLYTVYYAVGHEQRHFEWVVTDKKSAMDPIVTEWTFTPRDYDGRIWYASRSAEEVKIFSIPNPNRPPDAAMKVFEGKV